MYPPKRCWGSHSRVRARIWCSLYAVHINSKVIGALTVASSDQGLRSDCVCRQHTLSQPQRTARRLTLHASASPVNLIVFNTVTDADALMFVLQVWRRSANQTRGLPPSLTACSAVLR
jgi:hypothetical protein